MRMRIRKTEKKTFIPLRAQRISRFSFSSRFHSRFILTWYFLSFFLGELFSTLSSSGCLSVKKRVKIKKGTVQDLFGTVTFENHLQRVRWSLYFPSFFNIFLFFFLTEIYIFLRPFSSSNNATHNRHGRHLAGYISIYPCGAYNTYNM